ncbi:MAG: DeoR/GlpR family DNA-binding transcription regulator [Peptoniphilaceae bacterium]|nr:DeoR/GlpR family DNA-binding transcription regulator [Peptoniphilaceae bacterium]MDY3737951.1 DeoR/GlpR family DNA-binding transcription regulator [Peptoniphilaceae bacterium]
MIPEERYKKIKDILNEEKTISISNLSKKMYVSESTIRRDVDYLENSGFLLKIRGGVTLVSNNNTEYPSFVRKLKNVNEKQYIVKTASKYFLKDDSSIFLDDSSTVNLLNPYIENHSQIVIITNSIDTALSFNSNKNIRVLLSGGRLKLNSSSLYGVQVYDFLNSFYADYLFTSCKYLDEKNVYESDENLSEIKRIMVKNSTKKILLADSSKFYKKSFISTCQTREFDYIVTDKKPEDKFIKSLKPFTKVIWE